MGDVTVTLQFDDHLLDVECDEAIIPNKADNDYDVPLGYVRIETSAGYDPHGEGQVPMIGEGNTALVRKEHVAMVQRED
jgi:hypothetical protein